MENTSLGHIPSSNKWIFDDLVARVFPDMLQRSIPQYQVMRQGVYDLGMRFVKPQTYLVDLGCSRGDSLAPFISEFGAENRYIGIDNSEPMLAIAKDRFRDEIEKGWVILSNMNLATRYPLGKSSLTLCVLTLQFISPEHRQRIINTIYQQTVPGGALILVEKLSGSTGEIDDIFIELYHRLKSDNGYSKEEIERKSLALKGVLMPLTAQQNEEMLRVGGFSNVDCFWRWMNFGGFLGIKERP